MASARERDDVSKPDPSQKSFTFGGKIDAEEKRIGNVKRGQRRKEGVGNKEKNCFIWDLVSGEYYPPKL